MNAPIHPTMLQALQGFMPPAPAPKRSYYGEITTVDFIGFELVLELDYEGFIEGIFSPDGTPCYSVFKTSIPALDKLVEAQRKQNKRDSDYDKGEERYNDKELA